MVLVRGTVLPILRLHRRFGVRPSSENPAEGILIVFHAISWWVAVAVAALVVVGWFSFAHRLRSETARQAGWIAAVSQALVALVPVLVLIVGTLALIVVAILAVVALVLLFSSRDYRD